ncbi:fibronectin type III domain-containing protein (plasmid) [Microtetraspora malaysiensis]|uniref:fibronectin type III domain-containing protein n=1 Tax=Microtetraspora malaysiensis TaxID=161358 RepID=UPI003D9470DB
MCSAYKLSSYSSGWTMDASSEGSHGLYVFSKIATGSESSFAWSITSNGTSQFAIAYERDNCPNVLFAGSGRASSSPLTASVTVPAGPTNPFVVAAVTAGSTSASPPSWPHGLSNDYDGWGSNSVYIEAFFASGTSLPPPGQADYTVVTTFSQNLIPLVVVGYGQADSVPPSVPGNLRTTGVSGASIDVAWDASTDNIGVAGYGVWLDGVKQGGDQTALTKSFTGLTPGRSYLIEVDAADTGGNRSPKAALTVTTDGTPPTVPGNLHAVAVTPYSATLAWDPSTDNLGVAGYGAYVGSTKYGADVAATTVTIDGLTPLKAYTLRVDAADAAGNRSAKASVSVTTTADQPPTTPPGLVADLVQGTAFRVSWGASSDDYALTGYGVYLDGVKVGEQQELSRTFTGLARGATYLVEVDAVDNIGQRSGRASVSVTTIASTLPTIPGNLTATAEGDTISLAWGASVDDTGVARYEVMLDGAVVATTTGLAYVLGALVRGSTYLVEVVAVDDDGGRSAPASILATLAPPSWMPTSSPTYEIGEWAANVRDQHGVYWTVEREDGWSDSPPVSALFSEKDASDGAFVGDGWYGPRLIVLEGLADAPSRSAMLAAQERLLSVLPPDQVGLLRVAEAHMTRQAEVRLADQIDITDVGALAFRWTLTVRAENPRRYAIVPIYSEATATAMPGTATISVTFDGDYPTIPGVLTVFGPIKGFTITHAESGLVIMAKPGVELPADDRYSVEIDLRTRLVWAHVPEEFDPEPRPGRSLLGRFPAWFSLRPGPNTLVLSGAAGAGSGRPRLVLTARDAWQ